MGKMELKVRKERQRKNLQLVILRTVQTAGLLSVALLAPNAIRVLSDFGLINIKKRQKEFIRSSRNRLIEAKLLEKSSDGFLQLTTKGEAKLRQLELHNYKIPKPKKWDKKWRVLIFDIPETRKTTREKVRNTLTAIGFRRLQDSVWVYPYDCEDLITLLKADFKIGKDLLYLIVEEMEGDKKLREKFALL